jgi:hypothetical protein
LRRKGLESAATGQGIDGHRGIAAGRGNRTIDVTKRANLFIVASRCQQGLDPLLSSVSCLPKWSLSLVNPPASPHAIWKGRLNASTGGRYTKLRQEDPFRGTIVWL